MGLLYFLFYLLCIYAVILFIVFLFLLPIMVWGFIRFIFFFSFVGGSLRSYATLGGDFVGNNRIVFGWGCCYSVVCIGVLPHWSLCDRYIIVSYLCGHPPLPYSRSINGLSSTIFHSLFLLFALLRLTRSLQHSLFLAYYFFFLFSFTHLTINLFFYNNNQRGVCDPPSTPNPNIRYIRARITWYITSHIFIWFFYFCYWYLLIFIIFLLFLTYYGVRIYYYPLLF